MLRRTRALLGGVAEYEPAATLAAGVHDGVLDRGRELLEHLGTQALDLLDREAPEGAAGDVNGTEDAAALPVADRVLVHAQHSSDIANVQ